MNLEMMEVLPTFWSPTNTTLNLLNFGIKLLSNYQISIPEEICPIKSSESFKNILKLNEYLCYLGWNISL